MATQRYEALDGWRGIAALAIAFYHVPIAHPFREMAGWKNLEFFVDFFFVLSGFVIMHAWGNRLSTPQAASTFMQRRFWRVWPLHFMVLSGFVSLELVKLFASFVVALPLEDAPFTQGRSWASLLTNILMSQSLNLHGTTTWNGPAWSISVEFWSYLLFAFVMVVARGKTLALAAMALLGCLGVLTFSTNFMFATHDFGLFRAVYGFFVGAVTYRLIQKGQSSAGTGMEIAAVIAMLVWLVATGMNLTSLMAPLVFAGMVTVFAHGKGMVSRFVESRPVQALGLWSYSIYLVHTLIYYVLRIGFVFIEKKLGVQLTASGSGGERIFTFGSGLADSVAILALLALSVVISRFTYLYIEKPYMAVGGASATNAKPGLAIAG